MDYYLHVTRRYRQTPYIHARKRSPRMGLLRASCIYSTVWVWRFQRVLRHLQVSICPQLSYTTNCNAKVQKKFYIFDFFIIYNWKQFVLQTIKPTNSSFVRSSMLRKIKSQRIRETNFPFLSVITSLLNLPHAANIHNNVGAWLWLGTMTDTWGISTISS